MANKVVEVIIRAKDLTGTVVSRFQRRWRAMERTIRTVTRSVVAFTAATAAAVVGLTKLGERGDEVNAVKAAFARITDDETAALKRLRQASAGTIADFKLMSLANQAITLGAADTVEQFAEMVEVSRALGRAQGVDALSALESLTIGLARQSPRILDNIGLQIKLGDTTTFAARAMEQARQKAAELTGGMQSGTSWGGRFRASMSNLADTLSTFVAESEGINSFFSGLSDVATGVADAIATQNWEVLGEVFRTIGKMMGDKLIQGINLAIKAAIPNVGGGILSGLAQATGIPIDAIIGMRERLASSFQTSADTMGLNFESDLDTLRGLLDQLRVERESQGGGSSRRTSRSSGIPSVSRRTMPRIPLGSPGLIGPVQMPPVPDVTSDVPEAARDFSYAGQVAVASFSSMATAAIRGSDQVASSVIGMITAIGQSLPGVGGIFSAVIGGVGGIIGALASGGRDRAVPVRLAEVDDSAAKALANSGEPLRVTTIIEQGGVEIERIERDLIDRQNRDETVRFSRGTAVGSIG